MQGSQATFLYIFRGTVPMILKIPVEASKVDGECRFYENVYRSSSHFVVDVPLVPVQILNLCGSAQSSKYSPVKVIEKGILMPRYSSSLCDIPVPISAEVAVVVGLRIVEAIKCMHACEYLHGDIKPGNIFIDSLGQAWLGDYGSSVAFTEVKRFSGGTARYQCAEVLATSSPQLFDFMGLALTLLEKCGLMVLRNGFINNMEDCYLQSE
jgi:serine/threonine protein kinase